MANDTFKKQIREANASNRRDPLGLKERRQLRRWERGILVNEEERIAILTGDRGEIIGSLGPDEENNLRLTENAPLTDEERRELLDRWNEQFGNRAKPDDREAIIPLDIERLTPCASCGHPKGEHNRKEVGFLETILFCDDRLCACSGFEVRTVASVNERYDANLSIDKRRSALIEDMGRGYVARQVPLEISQKAVELIDAASKEREAIRMRAVSQAEAMFYVTTSSITNLEVAAASVVAAIEQALEVVSDNPTAMGRVNRVKLLIDNWRNSGQAAMTILKNEIDEVRRQNKT